MEYFLFQTKPKKTAQNGTLENRREPVEQNRTQDTPDSAGRSFTCIVPLVRCMMMALGVRIQRLICGMEEEDAVLTKPCLGPLPPSPPSVRVSSMYCTVSGVRRGVIQGRGGGYIGERLDDEEEDEEKDEEEEAWKRTRRRKRKMTRSRSPGQSI